MKRLLLTTACWLAFCVAPGESQQSTMGRYEDMPVMVSSEPFPNGWTGMTGPCRPSVDVTVLGVR